MIRSWVADSISHNTLSQIFDVVQSDEVLHSQVHKNVGYSSKIASNGSTYATPCNALSDRETDDKLFEMIILNTINP